MRSPISLSIRPPFMMQWTTVLKKGSLSFEGGSHRPSHNRSGRKDANLNPSDGRLSPESEIILNYLIRANREGLSEDSFRIIAHQQNRNTPTHQQRQEALEGYLYREQLRINQEAAQVQQNYPGSNPFGIAPTPPTIYQPVPQNASSFNSDSIKSIDPERYSPEGNTPIRHDKDATEPVNIHGVDIPLTARQRATYYYYLEKPEVVSKDASRDITKRLGLKHDIDLNRTLAELKELMKKYGAGSLEREYIPIKKASSKGGSKISTTHFKVRFTRPNSARNTHQYQHGELTQNRTRRYNSATNTFDPVREGEWDGGRQFLNGQWQQMYKHGQLTENEQYRYNEIANAFDPVREGEWDGGRQFLNGQWQQMFRY